MRIALVQSSPYLPSLGGANKANRLLLEQLAARGHACHAIGLAGSPALPAFRHEGVEVEAVQDASRLRGHVAERLRALAPDWVLVSSEDPAQMLLQAALEACPSRVVYIAHTTLHLPFGPDGFLDSPARTALLRQAAGVIAVSGYVRDYIRRWAGIEATVLRFPVYGDGPFPDLADFEHGAVTLINPCAVKGIAIFLELARRCPDVPFLAVPTWGTTDEDREALEALTNVRLRPPSPDIDEIFRETRALLVPSLWGEAFGQVAVEAMLRGIPVLASDVGGLPEAMLGMEYVLPVNPIRRYEERFDERRIPVADVPAQDVGPWERALRGLLDDRGLYERLSRQSRATAHAFVKDLGAEPFERWLEGLRAPAAAGKRRMKILLVQPLSYLFSPGGAHKANRVLAEGLAGLGHEVRVVAPPSAAGTDTREELRGRLEALGAQVLAETPAKLVFRHLGVEVHAAPTGIDLAGEAVRQVRDFAPDWVVVSEDRTFSLHELLLREAPDRVVCFAHSPATLPFGPDSFGPDPRLAELVRRSAGVLTVSRWMADYIRRWGDKEATVVYSPVYGTGPFPRLANFDGGFVMMINPSGIKGISIFAELARRMPDVPFAAVPTWSTRDADRELLASLPNVRLLTPFEDLDELFAQTRALLVPSLWGEAFGQIVVEAMLRGIPVLASDAGALPEAKLGLDYVLPVRPIERYETRFDEKLVPEPVIPEQDAGPWERALRELLSDRGRYERLSEESWQRAADFVADLGIEPYERFFASLSPVQAPAIAPPKAAEAGLREKLDRLSPERLELLKRRLRRKEEETAAPRDSPAAAIPRLPRHADGGGVFPVSFAQQRIWILHRLDPDSANYNEYLALRIQGGLRPAVLAASLSAIARRHEVLRTRYQDSLEGPVQVIEPPSPVPVPEIDLRAVPAGLREAEAERITQEESRRPFNLATGPVLRTVLLRLAGEPDEEHRLLFTLHHIASDHWSIAVALHELSELYQALSAGRAPALPELPIQYADFSVWQRQWLSGESLETQLAYWRTQLAGAPRLLELPTDRPRPPVQGYRGAGTFFYLPRPLAASLKALARGQDATLYMLLLAAFATLLNRYASTSTDDVVIGTPTAGRGRKETEGLIGFFLNSLPMRVRPSADLTFRALLEQVRRTAVEAFARQDLPFEKLVEELAPQRDLGYTPIFQVLLNLQNTPPHGLSLGGLQLTPMPVDLGVTKFDLNLYIEEYDQTLSLHLTYSTDLFDATTALRLLGHFRTLLEHLEPGLDRPLSELPLLTAPEAHQATAEWNDTGLPLGEGTALHQLVEAQAARTPDATAVVFEEESLTYAELWARAAGLAQRLRRLGIGPESRVGVAMERSLELLPALLGVLQAGAAYVPLDPEYPRERLAGMMEDARPDALITQSLLLLSLPDWDGRTLCLDRAPEPATDAPEGGFLDGRQLAYMIYTSGSTGRPKGAMVHHRGIVNRLLWMQDAYRLTAADTVLQKTPLSFDVSVWELFWPLAAGARLVLARPGGHRDSAYLKSLIARERVTVLHFVPSMLQLFLQEPELEACPPPRLVVASGEALPPELERRFAERWPGTRLENLYGPTEASVDVTAWTCSAEEGRRSIPIGRPVAATRIHLLDRAGRPLPTGIPGELHIGGVQVGRGYLDRPTLTAEKFVPDPFAAEPGARLYRTGDLARTLPGGEIEFLGRIDHQVKIRGFRIELGEIESVLAEHPGVREAAVVTTVFEGDARLVAYVVPASEPAPTAAELQDFLSQRLPAYMVPGVFTALHALPLTPSGKVDRRALPEPDGARLASGAPFAAPDTPVERELARLWSEALGRPEIGLHDSFFALGGHSLLATQLIARYRQAFGVELALRQLFEAPTLGQLARVIESRQESAEAPAAPASGIRKVAREAFRVKSQGGGR